MVFKPERTVIGPLMMANGVIATTETEIAEGLHQTFFIGQHLQEPGTRFRRATLCSGQPYSLKSRLKNAQRTSSR